MEGHEGCLLCGLVGNEIDTDRGRYKYTSTLCRRHADRVEDIDTASCYNPITEHHPNRPGSECIGTVARQVHMAGSVSMLCFDSISQSSPTVRGFVAHPGATSRCDEPVRRAGAARFTTYHICPNMVASHSSL